MILSEAANRVIDLSNKITEYYTAELPKYHRHYPLIGPDEETAPPPPEEKELKEFLSTLSDDMISRLSVIMDLGFGFFGTDELAEKYQELKNAPSRSELDVMAPLADRLLDGLEELRKHKINVDKMPLKKVKLRKR